MRNDSLCAGFPCLEEPQGLSLVSTSLVVLDFDRYWLGKAASTANGRCQTIKRIDNENEDH
jgi:hypothetical protein